MLIDLCARISSAFDRREYAIGVFLDLSQAFDTVNHAILFDKLEHYGIRGLALEWVKSYFSERAQFVEFNNVRSSPQGISRGVPRGSILGTLFFILYVDDLNNASLLDVILFADDTNLFISHNAALRPYCHDLGPIFPSTALRQPHLCFCLHARIWQLYFIRSLSKRRIITVKLLKIKKDTFRNTAYSKTIRICLTMLYQ